MKVFILSVNVCSARGVQRGGGVAWRIASRGQVLGHGSHPRPRPPAALRVQVLRLQESAQARRRETPCGPCQGRVRTGAVMEETGEGCH